MSKEAMLKAMCSFELSQADLKEIGRSRGFDSETLSSRALLQHVYLSEQGVGPALASLTEAEVLGLHLLSCLGEEVGVEFFKRMYPASAATNSYLTFTDRFKGLLVQVKGRLIRRGILLFHTPPKGLSGESALERMRFLFPQEFVPFLPAPFRASRLEPGTVGHVRQEVFRSKLMEILHQTGEVPNPRARSEQSTWRFADGKLLFDGKAFRAVNLEAWPWARLKAAFPGPTSGLAQRFQPVELLRHTLSRLGEQEWVVAEDLLPLWKVAFPGSKASEPQSVCQTGYQLGALEKAEEQGREFYRMRSRPDPLEGVSPNEFLSVEDREEIVINLERASVEGLEPLTAVSRLRVVNGAIRAAPSLVQISHAAPETFDAPEIRWVRENHPAFRRAFEEFKSKRGQLIVHENLLVARVRDLGLKVMLEKQFAGRGQLVVLSSEFVAFPNSLLSGIQAAVKKAGNVIKTIDSQP